MAKIFSEEERGGPSGKIYDDMPPHIAANIKVSGASIRFKPRWDWSYFGLTLAFHPFFWTWDFSWQPNWSALSIEIGPLAIRLGLPKRG